MERQCYNIRFYADDIQLFVSVSCSQSGQSNTPVNLSPVISQSHELFFQAFRPHPCTQFLPDCFELQPLLPAVCFGLVSLSQPCLWPARLISTLVKKKKKQCFLFDSDFDGSAWIITLFDYYPVEFILWNSSCFFLLWLLSAVWESVDLFGDLFLVNKLNSLVQTPFLCAAVRSSLHLLQNPQYSLLDPKQAVTIP